MARTLRMVSMAPLAYARCDAASSAQTDTSYGERDLQVVSSVPYPSGNGIPAVAVSWNGAGRVLAISGAVFSFALR